MYCSYAASFLIIPYTHSLLLRELNTEGTIAEGESKYPLIMGCTDSPQQSSHEARLGAFHLS